MFDYETLAGLETFRDVRLEPLPVMAENDKPLFRTAYSLTHGDFNSNHIEGVVLLVRDDEARVFRQIHLYKGI